jgi:hypothetical protein
MNALWSVAWGSCVHLRSLQSNGKPECARSEWLETRLAAERQTMLRAVVKIVGQSLGETLADNLAAERDVWESRIREAASRVRQAFLDGR